VPLLMKLMSIHPSRVRSEPFPLLLALLGCTRPSEGFTDGDRLGRWEDHDQPGTVRGAGGRPIDFRRRAFVGFHHVRTFNSVRDLLGEVSKRLPSEAR